VTIHMTAIEQYVHVILFIMLHVVQSFNSVYETLACDNSNSRFTLHINRPV